MLRHAILTPMTTVTIPKKGVFVLVPRKEYEKLVQLKKTAVREVALTPSQRRAINAARRRFARGDYLTLDELKRELGYTR